ncbi:MAG: guanylate kinase [Rhodospirillales bacterium]|jgi:guanylate kinase|nr:guanylate kinase [Rhodospirillales bacterium]MBT4041236.1 guanylate kinase [Rhodospirillales bacterium]MBT4625226.1 guanylate kinase [Rhodospirillales bacterium]MBT5353389.1 guanylate kinase [Rhodospirillales bacterium]MBT5519876.1 guanylate kinase [Rhodospirillales bacterium]
MLVLSSPSGAGKSTIARTLLANDGNLTMSVSATTREARPGEVDGEHYYFVTRETFDQMVADDEFLEHATVFGNSYGTPKAPVETAMEAGRDVLFDVDWQGAQEIQQYAHDDLVSVFVLPPSIEELERRLFNRAQDSEDVVRGRMDKATSEMSHWDAYEYVIINDEIEKSVSNVTAILASERLKRRRQNGLLGFVRALGVGQ